MLLIHMFNYAPAYYVYWYTTLLVYYVTGTICFFCVSWHKGARREADEALVAKREAETKTAELVEQTVGRCNYAVRSPLL